MSEIRILGVIMVRNAWPLAGVAVTHALDFVDEVLVVDHGSSDDGPAGYTALEAAWPGRVHRFRLDTDRFWQEATIGAALRTLGLARFDWVYPFDADEFALADPMALRATLARAPANVLAARYELDNYVVPEDATDAPESLLRTGAISQPHLLPVDLPDELAAMELAAGAISLFDLPFDSKVIHRADPAIWATAGGHALRAPRDADELRLRRDEFRVAHVPIRSRASLERRAEQGERLRASGFPPSHGWQNQAFASAKAAGQLDALWVKHSLPADGAAPAAAGRPLVVPSDALREAVGPAVEGAAALTLGASSPARELSPEIVEALALGWAGAAAEVTVRAELADVERQRDRAADAYRALEIELHEARDRYTGEIQRLEAIERELSEHLTSLRKERDAHRREIDRLTAVLDDERRAREELQGYADWRASQVREIHASISFRALQKARRALRGEGERPTLPARAVSLVLRQAVALRGRRRAQAAALVQPEEPASPLPTLLTLPQFEHPTFSIVIPVYSDPEMTLACLRAIHAASADGPTYEVIVGDDEAPEDVAAMLGRVDGIRVIRNAENQGFLRTVNRAAAEARAPYLVLLNNDTEPQPGWLAALLERFEQSDRVGAVGGRLVYPDGLLQEAGGVLFADGSAINYGNRNDPGAAAFRFARPVDYCSAALLGIRTELWQELGGFDELFVPGYYEDTDLCFRVREAGSEVWFEPRAVVLHKEGGSHGTDVTQGVKRYQVVNQAHFVERWGSVLQARPATATVQGSWRWANRTDGPVVFVADHMVPEPDRDSGSLRMTELLTAMVELGARVIFHPFNGYATPGYTQALEAIGIEVLDGATPLRARLHELGEVCQLAVLSRPAVAAQLLPEVRTLMPNATVLYDTVDLHWIREESRREFEPVPDGLITALRELELGLVRSSDLSAVVSGEERATLGRLVPEADIRYLPNVHEIVPGPGFVGRVGVLFIGGFRHLPNIDAAMELGERIMPAVRERRGGITLSIVGPDAPEQVEQLQASDIDVLGWVDDVVPLLDRSLALVAPLRYGAGMKGKIGQALAHGLPVITSAIGAQGFGLVDGVDVLLADTPEEYAAAILRLQDDPELWERLSVNGRAVIERSCSRTLVQQIVRELLVETADSAPVNVAARR